MNTETFEISIKEMCLEYAVELPFGFSGDETVEVFHDENGWHVGPAYPGEGIENLGDDEWAPTDDTMRENLRNRAAQLERVARMTWSEKRSATMDLICCPDTSDYTTLAQWVREYIDPGNTLDPADEDATAAAIKAQIETNLDCDVSRDVNDLDALDMVADEFAHALLLDHLEEERNAQ